MKRYFPLLVLTILFYIYGQNLGFAATHLQLEPTHIQPDETFRIILTTDNIRGTGDPDLAPLQRDFTILGTEHSISYSIINGHTTSLGQWRILLRPKKVGKLVIPAIQIGSEHTDAGTVTVSDASTQPAAGPDSSQQATHDLMLKTSVSEQSPYINQQVLYTVRFYNAEQLLNVEYHPPTVDNALLVSLGNGRHYETQIHGSAYQVEEQQYAIFPQKSGPLTINPPQLNATVYDGIPKEMHIRTNASTLSVRPAPAHYQEKNWLPAKNIALSETYEPSVHTVKEGDILTRTVTLQAEAMPSQLLPTLTFEANAQLSVYPESPEGKNTTTLNGLIGTTTTKVTYLINQAGQITIPELKVRWFNTGTGKIDSTVLPARILMAKSNGKVATRHKPKTTSLSSTITQKKADKPTTLSVAPVSPNYQIIYAVAIGFMAACGLIALCWWIRRSRVVTRERQIRQAIRRVEDACQKNQPEKARRALLDFAQLQWPEANILNLQDVAKLTQQADLKQHLSLLSEVLYDLSHQHTWQGARLLESFKKYSQMKGNQRSRHKSTSSGLPPINPTI